MSGTGNKEEAIDTVRRGAQDYLVKGQVTSDMIVRSMLYAMERKHLEDERHNMLYIREQEQRLKSLGTMAAGLAHEINTPLQFVGTNISFMEKAYRALEEILTICDKLGAPESNDVSKSEIIENIIQHLGDKTFVYMRSEMENALRESSEGIRRLHEIVKAMSVFARSSNGQRVKYDINRAVRDAILISRPQWKNYAAVQLNLAEDLPAVSCIAEKVYQAILNVIINAAQAVEQAQKAMQTNVDVHEKGLIQISTSKADPYVQIQIADSGVGIPEEIKPHIFDPFFTTKDIDQGTGQGLSFVREIIVARHGGKVKVSSNQGAGSVFTISLPINKPEDLNVTPQKNDPYYEFSQHYASLLSKG